jgi:hypothetical protein
MKAACPQTHKTTHNPRRSDFEEPQLFGGRPEAELAAIVRASGFDLLAAEPLMDAKLWTETPHYPRYIIIATKSSG